MTPQKEKEMGKINPFVRCHREGWAINTHHRNCEDWCPKIKTCPDYDLWQYNQAEALVDGEQKELEKEAGVMKEGG